MCGIFGVVGEKHHLGELIDGLKNWNTGVMILLE